MWRLSQTQVEWGENGEVGNGGKNGEVGNGGKNGEVGNWGKNGEVGNGRMRKWGGGINNKCAP